MRATTLRCSFIALVVIICFISPGCRSIQDSSEQAQDNKISPNAEQFVEPKVKVVYPSVPGSFVATAKKIKPSVVNVFTAQLVRESPLGGWHGFSELFGLPHRERIQRSLGSGFIIDAQGYVLTNYHVVRGAHEILAQLEDGREVPAIPVGADVNIDMALLHLEQSGLSPAVLGDSDALEVGEWVAAVGNPFGLGHTVTAGIVSAKGRDYRDIGVTPHGYQSYIQTDASINPGNSGGPLVNVEGEVVGINTAISASGQGISFAVPINMVKMILPQLKRTGRVVPAWIGVGIRSLTSDQKKKLGIDHGVMITEVFPKGPAANAGIKPGDIITIFNGSPVRDTRELAWLANTAGVGNTVIVQFVRSGRRVSAKFDVAAKPSAN